MKLFRIFAIFLTALSISCADHAPSEIAPQNSNLSKLSTSRSGASSPENLQQVNQQVLLSQAEKSQETATLSERKIVRHANLHLEAESPEEAQRKITAVVEGKGGYVVESQQSSSDVKTSVRDIVTMEVRVPSAKFNEALEEIRRTSSRVVVETIKSDDITEEFIDIESRLKAQKALEAQFLEIMKRANTVEDALNVQRNLAEVRGEIEKIEGRMRFLQNQTSFSTIEIRLQTPMSFSAGSPGFFYQLGESVGKGIDAAISFTLGLITFLIAILPFSIFVALPIFLLIKYFWRGRKTEKEVLEVIE